jgi:hypothetical protein
MLAFSTHRIEWPPYLHIATFLMQHECKYDGLASESRAIAYKSSPFRRGAFLLICDIRKWYSPFDWYIDFDILPVPDSDEMVEFWAAMAGRGCHGAGSGFG